MQTCAGLPEPSQPPIHFLPPAWRLASCCWCPPRPCRLGAGLLWASSAGCTLTLSSASVWLLPGGAIRQGRSAPLSSGPVGLTPSALLDSWLHPVRPPPLTAWSRRPGQAAGQPLKGAPLIETQGGSAPLLMGTPEPRRDTLGMGWARPWEEEGAGSRDPAGPAPGRGPHTWRRAHR